MHDCTAEDDTPETLEKEAGMPDTAPSAIKFKTFIKDVTRMKPAMIDAEMVRSIMMGVADIINKTEWRSPVRQRFQFVPRYGRLVVYAVLEGIIDRRTLASGWSLKPFSERSLMTLTNLTTWWRRCC